MIGLLAAALVASQGVGAPAVEPLGRIGCESCGDARELAEISSVGVGGGLVWVATGEPPFIRAFDQKGVPARAFGVRGGGPGELAAAGFVVAAGGEIFVVDYRARRVARYDSAGRYRAGAPLSGFPIDVAVSASREGPCVLTSEFRPGSNLVRCLGRDGGWRTAGGPFPGLEVRSIAFARDGRMAVADGESEYLIRVIDPSGRSVDLVRQVKREAALRDTRVAARAGALAGAEARGRGPGPPPTGPTLRPYVNWGGLRFDDGGRLWVLTGRGGPAATVFDVFGADGTFLGEVTLPGRGRTFGVAGSLLAVAGEDAGGVPIVTLWRIR